MPLASDGNACRLVAGQLEAIFLPAQGMLGASLKHAGVELLRQVHDLEERARGRQLAGVPLLHPWANRLGTHRFRAAGKAVVLDPASSLLSRDENGLLNHGVPWCLLAWDLLACESKRVQARLAWESAELLSVFPFRHALVVEAVIAPDSLSITTTVEAHEPTPVSFGFHPYFGLAGLSRERWRLRMPAMRSIELDHRRLPTGREDEAPSFDDELQARFIDQGYATRDPRASIVLSGGGRSIAVELLGGYRYLQIYAPSDAAYVCIEPMAAPANALVSGNALKVVAAGDRYRAAFRIRVAHD